MAANVTTYSNIALSPNTHYYYRVRAYNSLGDSAYSNTADAVTQVDPGSIFTVNGDIGLPSLAGSSSYYRGIYTIVGAGSDIWDVSDQFQYDYKDQTGNANITARVYYIQNTNTSAKAGVMFRDGTGAAAMFIAVEVTPGNGVAMQWRNATGGTCSGTTIAGIAAPQWVKLVRSGNNFTGYYSANGVIWTPIGTQTIAMASAAKVGLAVTSHDVGRLCTAVFDNVSVNTASPTNITLSNNNVAENQSAGTAVGIFSTTDPDFGNTFTYSLVTGTGSTDNTLFSIVGNSLRTAALFDYETKNSFSIRVRTTDQGGLSFDKIFTISATDMSESMILLPSDLPSTGVSNLTLKVATDGRLHIYQTGGTTNIVPPHVLSNVTDVSITGRDGYDEVLTLDITGGNPIPPGGVSFNGGAGGGNSLVIYGTSGNISVATTTAQQITVNGSAAVNYTNVAFFGFNLGGINNSLLIANSAMLKINQDNAISAGTNVTIDGGTLDLIGKTDTIDNLLLKSGSVLSGTLYANAYNIESGTVTANIVGPGGLQKTTTGQATTGVVSTSNVTVDAGQLTATSINTGTLTLGPGTRITIAPIPGGPTADNALAPLATSTVQPIPLKPIVQPTATDAAMPSSTDATVAATAEPLAANTVLALPVSSPSEVTTMAVLSCSLSNTVLETVATPKPIVADIALPVRLPEHTQTSLIDTTINRLLPQSPISSRIDLTALPWIIENWLKNPLAEKQINNSKTLMLTSLQEESLSHSGIIEKRVYTQAIYGRQAHFAALQTNSRWSYFDTEEDFDIAQHFHAGKHSKQFEKAIDEVLAEEEDIMVEL